MKLKNSILFKTILIVTASVVVFLCLFGRYTYTFEKERLLNETKTRQEIRFKRIANSLVESVWSYDNISARRIISFDETNQDIMAIIIRNENREIFEAVIRKGSSLFEYISEKDLKSRLPKSGYIVSMKGEIKRSGEPIGYLEVYFSEEEVQSEIRNIILRILLQTVIIALVIIVSVYFTLRRVIGKPIRELSLRMEEISEGNYMLKLQRKSDDEIGRLIGSFNRMIDRLEVQRSELMNSEIKYRSIFDEASDGIVLVKDWELLEANKKASQLFGITKERAGGIKINEFLNSGENPFSINITEIVEKALTGEPQHFECRFAQSTGEKIFADVNLHKVELQGEVILLAIIRDITSRKTSEDKIRTSLREKEILLKEIHHRVKNNLQVISSLLNLQSGFIEDKMALEMFRNSQDRVKSMALIHEKLYKSGDLSSINFGEYVRSLASSLFKSYRVNHDSITLKIEIPGNVYLGVDTAIPCGLIINELVTNALKYAFPDRPSGEVGIRFCSDGQVNSLAVYNDGQEFPRDQVDLVNPKTLGLQLVSILSSQLKGSFQLNTEVITEFIVTFPVKKS
ncbi:MAG: histidine kinase dimerization/phosphoacceptor domain -containing protein [Bacteroidota bacterium]|jgi:PAS domain S-box-containing protein|nr:PAS domain S-box protein [Ignavibacteria bacterium]MCU7497661.1 PAS domain S-box protein [Ignavibacteria bacterium]MCU7511034.1 PAS domain S-box protein [Ignavibacteria bacterium]MCU7518888.1 PAS domain S-box protein [Ignavibacteria bacterium]MCU7523144.1 PAS domain S-box protein [Ignavibacteria bacterium]